MMPARLIGVDSTRWIREGGTGYAAASVRASPAPRARTPVSGLLSIAGPRGVTLFQSSRCIYCCSDEIRTVALEPLDLVTLQTAVLIAPAVVRHLRHPDRANRIRYRRP